MLPRTCAAHLLLLSACATTPPRPTLEAADSLRLANLQPPDALERERRLECEPIPVPHLGKDDAHDQCADRVPPNRYPGMDVLVNGIYYDALQVGVRVLWEIKTEKFDTYSEFVQEQVVKKEIPKLREERRIAVECGYEFVVGVSTEAHKKALERVDPELKIVVTGCPR